jgi:hypothetical protein
MGPGVPQEPQQLVCVCANEFAQTLPHLHTGGLLLTRVRPVASCSARMRRGGVPGAIVMSEMLAVELLPILGKTF